MILTHFENLPNPNKKQGRRKSKVFERFVVCSVVCLCLDIDADWDGNIFRTHSYDEMNPRTKQKCRKVPRRSSSRWLLDWSDSTRRQSWHSEQQPSNQGLSDFVRFYWISPSEQTGKRKNFSYFRARNTQTCPIVIISGPETRQQINISLVPVVPSHHHDTSYQHYVQVTLLSRILTQIKSNSPSFQTRPCIVGRNLRKIFGK